MRALVDLPLVSIVIPVYNGANYLREAIDSALNQTYSNIEVIVVNDGSNDDGATHEIALSYEDKIQYYLKENGGVSSALNYGIKRMKGEFFAWLSHDDVHLPEKVEKQMDVIYAYKGSKPVICVCNFYLIDESGKELTRSPYDIEKYFRKSHKCFFGAETNLMIDGDATLISKQVFDLCGLFDESLIASQETDMWYRALNVAEFIFMTDYLVAYRTHSEQVTNKRIEAVGKEAGEYRGNLIKQLTTQEILEYYEKEKDAVRFGFSAYSYMYLFFYEASHQLIVKLRQLCSSDWEFVRNALKGMFEYGNIDGIFDIFKTQMSTRRNKTTILVYCQNWVADGFVKNLKELMLKLQPEYEFIFVYCGEKSSNFPENISSICFKQTAQIYMASYLALLAELFDVDIYWGNSGLFFPNAITLNYLKNSNIRTIASFHYLDPAAKMSNISLNEEDWQSPLTNASLITHEQHDLMFTQYLYPYDAILLPPVSGDKASCAKWNLLFQTVLSSDSYIDQIRSNFQSVDKIEESLWKDEVIQRIQKYLEKYEKYTLEKHITYYEKSPYWRITKPLRVIVDLFRKLIGQ